MEKTFNGGVKSCTPIKTVSNWLKYVSTGLYWLIKADMVTGCVAYYL